MVAAATVPGILQSGIHSARPSATAMAVGGLYSCSTHKLIYVSDGSTWTTWAEYGGAGTTRSIEFVIDGGGSVISTGVKGDIEVPYNCTITAARILADQSGSIVVNLWKDTYANYPPVVGDKITASAPPTISSATKSQDSTLTGWTTTVTAGDIIRFNVDSCSTITRVLVSLTVVVT